MLNRKVLFVGGAQFIYQSVPKRSVFRKIIFPDFRPVGMCDNPVFPVENDSHPRVFLRRTLLGDFLQAICYGLMGLGDTLLVLLFGWLNGVLKKREGNADEEETSPVAIFLEGMQEGPGETIALYLFGNVVAWASAFLGFKITLLLAPHIPEQVNGKIVLMFIIMLVLGLPVVRSFIRYLFYNIALSLAGSSFLGWFLFPISILLLEFVILKAIDNAQDTGVQLFLIHVKKAFKPDDSLIHRILFLVIMLVAVLTPAILWTMIFGNHLHNK